MKIKQVIVVRKDLNMRKGKIAAQVAHASLKVFFDKMEVIGEYDECHTHNGSYKAIIRGITPEVYDWMRGAFTKVVVSVDSEDEIYELQDKAKEAGILNAVIIDNGTTEFNGKKTTTCIAIGPASSDDLDPITGKLSLM